MNRDRICAEIRAERDRQDTLWGGAEHDDTLTLERWIVILTRQLGMACWDGSPDDVCHKSERTAKYDPLRYRKQIVCVAAVAVAALEAFDRRDPPQEYNGIPLRTSHQVIVRRDGDDTRGSSGAGEMWDAVLDRVEPPTPPAEFWAQVAARAGEPVLLLSKAYSVVDQSVRDCPTYAVLQSQATAWERANSTQTVTPDGTTTQERS